MAEQQKPWNKGKILGPLSRECRQKISDSLKLAWKQGKFGEERNKRLSQSLKGRKATEETRRKISESMKGHKPWNTGKHRSEETKRKQSEAMKKRWDDKEYRNFMTKMYTSWVRSQPKEFLVNNAKKAGKLNKGKKRPDLAIQNKDQEITKKRIEGIKKAIKEGTAGIFKAIKAQHERPNGLESKILSLLEQICPSEWKYVGDGTVVFGGLNPDIINVNGQKKIIEAFGDYWHTLEDEKKGREVFARYGFETLFVWQHELADEDALIRKLSTF